MELDCKMQNYAWGRRDKNSKVAQLYSSANPNFKIELGRQYAELWMGTHVNGPSVIKKSGELLSTLINENPLYLGKDVIQHFGKKLPFLFKVLSVHQPLSIQAHPSKKHAEELHVARPDLYKDDNHKPEMAIAITPFEALCGFRPLKEIAQFVKDIPELRTVIGESILKNYENDFENEDFLKEAFKAILIRPKTMIVTELKNLQMRAFTLDCEQRKALLIDLVERLFTCYAFDPGCFMAYFLNYIKLEPLEAIYLGANVPHAYLKGDCIECMACSDNVVRAGLTSKYIDIPTLCSMLEYKGKTAEENLFQPTTEDEYCKIFRPPVPDFAVIQIQLPKDLGSYKIPPRNSASILIVISGSAVSDLVNLVPGTTLFLPADSEVVIKKIEGDLLIYQAITNV